MDSISFKASFLFLILLGGFFGFARELPKATIFNNVTYEEVAGAEVAVKIMNLWEPCPTDVDTGGFTFLTFGEKVTLESGQERVCVSFCAFPFVWAEIQEYILTPGQSLALHFRTGKNFSELYLQIGYALNVQMNK